jgi:ethanolamine utilization protein EutP
MKKMMLVGETGSGKTSLIRALCGQAFTVRKTQAVEYRGQLVDTPGEYLENRRFYTALVTCSCDCGVIGLVQDVTRPSSIFPPLFARLFNKQTIGIITKVDLEGHGCARAERFLTHAGAAAVVRSSSKNNVGLGWLRAYLSQE